MDLFNENLSNAIVNVSSLPWEEITSRSRSTLCKQSRDMYAHFCYEYNMDSCSAIGETLNMHKDSVRTGIKRSKDLLNWNIEYASLWSRVFDMMLLNHDMDILQEMSM